MSTVIHIFKDKFEKMEKSKGGNDDSGRIFKNRVKFNRTILRQRIIDHAGIKNENGYVQMIEDNLILTTERKDFEDDLIKGNGNELTKKFRALYSSAALCVNYFGLLKRNLERVAILDEKNFVRAKFEEKLTTGLKGASPNIDFFLENENCQIGIESKFLEPLEKKKPWFSSSYSSKFLERLDPGLSEVVNHYRANNSKTYLDTAQLLKHSIGLLNNKGSKKARLIYLYWEPNNASDYHEYEQHREQLVDFAHRMKTISSISFHHFTYQEFCAFFSGDSFFKAHLDNFKTRYLF